MTTNLKALFASVSVILALSASCNAELPQANMVEPIKIVQVGEYTEGIVFDHDGNAYISHKDVITRVSPTGQSSVWATTGAPNGHKVLADGTHLVCDGSHHAVLKLDANGKILGQLSKECDGKPLRAPNDLSLDTKNAGVYFTDPGGSGKDNPIGTVHYVDATGKTTLLVGGLAFPNGIVLTPDGAKLYVGESQKNRVLVFPVLAPGKLGPLAVFAELPTKEGDQVDNQPDGMCLDAAGNLYVAHYGMRQVQVLGPDGKILRRYPGGNLTTSNVAFGGPNFDQLFVTGAMGLEQGSPGGLFRLDIKTKGLSILPPKAK